MVAKLHHPAVPILFDYSHFFLAQDTHIFDSLITSTFTNRTWAIRRYTPKNQHVEIKIQILVHTMFRPPNNYRCRNYIEYLPYHRQHRKGRHKDSCDGLLNRFRLEHRGEVKEIRDVHTVRGVGKIEIAYFVACDTVFVGAWRDVGDAGVIAGG